MILRFSIVGIQILLLFSIAFSQNSDARNTENLSVEESMEFISNDLREISKTIKSLNAEIVKAYGSLSSSMGLSLTENQQKILVTFEILNRAEHRLANLQKLRIELIEKQTSVNSKLSEVESDLRRENIDRSIALKGTTDAENLREQRRNSLNDQKSNLTGLLLEIDSTLSQTNAELRQTNQLVEQIRYTLFPAIYKELPKLNQVN